MDILIKRDGAAGDVLLATAILPALKTIHKNHLIYFETQNPFVLVGNPHVDYITTEPINKNFSLTIDLNLSYEKNPNESILKCYANEAKVPLELCKPYIAKAKVNKPLLNNYVVIHAGNTNWAGRNWSKDKWHEIAMNIHDAGHQIVCVGQKPDHFVPCDVDCRGLTSVTQLATIIEDAKLFVGIDSLPFNIAQVVQTPCVTFFGSINPKLRVFSKNVTPVTAKNLECLGCHHRQKAPTVSLPKCPLNTLDCENNVSVNDMWLVVKSKLGLHNLDTKSRDAK